MIYSAITDRTIRAKPALPNITAGAGTVFTDPTYGSRILRVTDANTRPDHVNRGWHTPSGSETNGWNADSTRFWLHGDGGEQILYSFNPTAFSTTRLGNLGNGSGGTVLLMNGEPEFSFTDSDLLYGQSSGFTDRLAQYRLSTDTETTLHDIQTVLPGVSSHGTGMSVSASPLRFALGIGGAVQDNDTYVYVWDPALGARYLNVSTGQIGGAWGLTGAYTGDTGFTIHNVRMSRNGRWLRVSPNGAPGGVRQYIWDITTKTLTGFTTWDGHQAFGYNHVLRQANAVDSLQCVIYDLLASTEIPVPTTPRSPTNFDSEGHPCWNQVQPDDQQPIISEMWKTAGTIAAAWDEEIVAIGVASGLADTVWRFCHHRTKIVGGFYEQPRPNVAPNGRVCLFSSNWEDTVGSGRVDVFAVELAQLGTSTRTQRKAALVGAL